ncbi:beta-glucuronidase [Pontibacter ummariensis]|uniref:Beta-glucuronidase n=1 Tax=Pontibacter ummariensis TaxID=1610492 RepID=A0A239GGK8_9BACT|nr:glycoside hydrolase family 2 TIM barrel-domain containing protein [Pontibacter ummariensis]PRY11260.1 beta-glucuronidase [Pontibacter ummariensis]SNS68337.1 beta-glucuronidase [Pontibacter ummariensis]
MKRKLTLLVILCFSICRQLAAQDPLLVNVYNRDTKTLNGKWHYIVDPYENGYYDYRQEPFDKQQNPSNNAYFRNYKPKDKTELVEYDFDKSPTLLVPGDWNSQEEKLFYYEGTVWYKKSFDYEKAKPNNRVYLYFDAVNYQADVYLNGEKLGTHKGGFTPFNFDVTGKLKPRDNFVVVKVDNKRKREEVPTVNTDWWNYGGITREVRLVEVPASFVQDYFLQLDPNNTNELIGYVQVGGEQQAGQKVQVNIPALKVKQEVVTDARGYAPLEVKVRKVNLWSPENPYLYDVNLRVNDDVLEDQIGFRSIRTEGADILLNNKPVFLKGISIHEENPQRGGRAYSEEDARILLNWAKELGCNFVRLAHYPHNEHMARMADKMGLMVWEENPVYWTIQWQNEDTYKTAERQQAEVITRDKNRASVIIWSMANETPVTPERTAFIRNLIAKTRSMDPTRLISAALEKHNINATTSTVDDPLIEDVDVLSFNQYIGWYDRLPDALSKTSWEIKQNKPVIVSEFGAGALQGLHGDKMERWTEEYQEYLYEETLAMLQKIPQLRGITPWILVDFRSPRRPLPNVQDGWNRKGLISQTGDKKKAFYVLQDFYKNFKLKDKK